MIRCFKGGLSGFCFEYRLKGAEARMETGKPDRRLLQIIWVRDSCGKTRGYILTLLNLRCLLVTQWDVRQQAIRYTSLEYSCILQTQTWESLEATVHF